MASLARIADRTGNFASTHCRIEARRDKGKIILSRRRRPTRVRRAAGLVPADCAALCRRLSLRGQAPSLAGSQKKRKTARKPFCRPRSDGEATEAVSAAANRRVNCRLPLDRIWPHRGKYTIGWCVTALPRTPTCRGAGSPGVQSGSSLYFRHQLFPKTKTPRDVPWVFFVTAAVFLGKVRSTKSEVRIPDVFVLRSSYFALRTSLFVLRSLPYKSSCPVRASSPMTCLHLRCCKKPRHSQEQSSGPPTRTL
jgi:hypothetical protein